MSDFLVFDAGANKVLDAGLAEKAKAKLLLSTRAVGEEEAGQHKHGDTLGGGVGEITGTGYAEQEVELPAAAARGKKLPAANWATGEHTDWPNNVKSVVMVLAGVAICAWNLRTGGAARDFSAAGTTEEFTGTFAL